MKLSLCNEVIAPGRDIAAQCALAASLGYAGLEIAPFTLSDEPHRLPPATIAAARRAASDAGIAISGLHWLLLKPDGLSITSADTMVREKTIDVMRRLVDLCAELGGTYVVHGSPGQRRVSDAADVGAARSRGVEAFALAGAHARQRNVTYCIEPLAPPAADFVTSVAEAADIVRAVGNPALRTMIDASAASNAEAEALDALAATWLPTGMIAHIHVNDRNRRGPGQGDTQFAPLFRVLHAQRYAGWIGFEPFDYVPDGPGAAARAVGYIQGIIEATS